MGGSGQRSAFSGQLKGSLVPGEGAAKAAGKKKGQLGVVIAWLAPGLADS
jgi:hypothetical protein